jgi:hypothetical protein
MQKIKNKNNMTLQFSKKLVKLKKKIAIFDVKII